MQLLDIVFQSGEFYNTQSSVDWTKIFGLIFSGLTLWLAFQIWKNFDVKKHFVKKQLDTVFDLYSDLTSIKLRYGSITFLECVAAIFSMRLFFT